MESLIETFHIDIKLLTAQAINFLIVFLVLYFFVLKPLFKTMQDRTKKIEKSLSDAKKAEDNLAKTENNYSAKMTEAKKEANKIIKSAKEQAEARKQEMVNKAKADIGELINSEKAKIQVEKAKTLKEIKGEAADLVALSVEKILGKKMNQKEDGDLIKKIIK
ncbi:MAG: F0F1 ATP synthase subunit B [Patescibacteria group bacterium]|nr:F0F1 ATP synthase subunit B [Patescibacteria group bacterium]